MVRPVRCAEFQEAANSIEWEDMMIFSVGGPYSKMAFPKDRVPTWLATGSFKLDIPFTQKNGFSSCVPLVPSMWNSECKIFDGYSLYKGGFAGMLPISRARLWAVVHTVVGVVLLCCFSATLEFSYKMEKTVGTRGALTNTKTATSVIPPNTSTLDDQTKAFIKQLINLTMAGTSNGGNRLQFDIISKLEVLKFTGVDVKNWLYKIQQFFNVEHVDDDDKVKLASIHFFDSALVWHQHFKKLNGNPVSWDDYQKDLLARFNTDFEDHLSELKNLKCDSTIQKYHEMFELLLNKVDMPEAHAISLFLGGMPQSISLPVRMFKAKSLSDTASLSRNQETPLALPDPKANIVNPTRKYLSQKEFDDKRAKGLCFHCDQKFVPGHKCSGQAFASKLVIDLEPQMEMHAMEGIKKEFIMPEVTNKEIPQISLNALTGLTSYRTMRVIGFFGLMGGLRPLLVPRLASKGGQLGLKPKVLSLTRGGLGKILQTYLTESDFGETNLGVWKDSFSVRASENL
nr:hypothetical protein [Tanacetum cinerariifolium]